MKYTAWLACGGKVEVDISAAGVDLTSITEGVQWITDKYGIMLNMAHVAALVPEDVPATPDGQAFDHDHEYGDPGEAPAEFPRLTGPVGMPERVRDGEGTEWTYRPDRGKYTMYGFPDGTGLTLDEIRSQFVGWTALRSTPARVRDGQGAVWTHLGDVFYKTPDRLMFYTLETIAEQYDGYAVIE